MNPTYKTAWNKGKKTVVLGALLTTAMMPSIFAAEAGIAIGTDAQATGDDYKVISDGGQTSHYANAIAIGREAKATSRAAVALGGISEASGIQSLAAGVLTKASGAYAVAIGLRAESQGVGAFAAGQNAMANKKGTVAIGANAVADGDNSLSLGESAKTKAAYAVALGRLTEASAESATALGHKAIASKVGSLAVGFGAQANNLNSIAIGRGANSIQEGTIAIGQGSIAGHPRSVALGAGAMTSMVVSTATSTVNVLTLDASTGLPTGISTAEVKFAGAAPIGTVSVGTVGGERTITNVGAGRINASSTDAVNGSQLYALGTAVDKNTSAIADLGEHINKGVNFKGDSATVINKKLGDTLTIIGGAATSTTKDNIAVVESNGQLVVKLANKIDLDDDGSLTVGSTVLNKDGASIPTVITNTINVNNGPVIQGGMTSEGISTPGSINMNEGSITNLKSGIVNGDERDNSNAANIGDVKQLVQNVNGDANAAVDKMGKQLRNEIADAGANAAALAALKPLQYDPMEPTQVMAGYGNYRGSSSLAFGVAHFKNESTMFHAGVALGGHDNMYNAGVTWKFGSRNAEAAIPDRYKAGPISSVYVMQDEVSSMKTQNARLLAENKAQKDKIADQDAKIAAQDAKIADMNAKIQLLMARAGL